MYKVQVAGVKGRKLTVNFKWYMLATWVPPSASFSCRIKGGRVNGTGPNWTPWADAGWQFDNDTVGLEPFLDLGTAGSAPTELWPPRRAPPTRSGAQGAGMLQRAPAGAAVAAISSETSEQYKALAASVGSLRAELLATQERMQQASASREREAVAAAATTAAASAAAATELRRLRGELHSSGLASACADGCAQALGAALVLEEEN